MEITMVKMQLIIVEVEEVAVLPLLEEVAMVDLVLW